VSPTTTIAGRLEDLGVALPHPAALALYRPAVRSGNTVYVSGQVAMREGAIVHPGRLGASLDVEQGREAARVCVINALGAANMLLGSLETVRVIRMVGYVASAPEFTDQPAVVNGASELLRDVFGDERGVGARLALGVTSLPANSPVEIELILEVD
jgi:enamine deaminase RidA (YjgF/YER057c/UK114 family)